MTVITKTTFNREVPGDWVAVQLGYTGDRCILDDHTKKPNAHRLRRWGDSEIVWYRCWPCDRILNPYDLLKETIARSDFDGDLEDETLHRAEVLYKEWRSVEGWESDERLFEDGFGSWTDLRPGDPGWKPPATAAELQQKIQDARDPIRLDQALQGYRRERKERTYPPSFDTFDVVPAEFIDNEFGWGCNDFDTFLVPLYGADRGLISIQYLNARKRWSERGHPLPAIYGLERRNDQARIVVVEGVADTVRLAWEYRDVDDTLVVGLLSASFTETKLPIEAFARCQVTILGDGGDAGDRATERLADALIKVASVSVVPLPEGYRDVCSYDDDLKALVATAQPRSKLHYLERPEVVHTLEEVATGISEVELQHILGQLPALPTDKLNQTMIRERLARSLKNAGFAVSIADSWIATAPREDPEFALVAGAVQERDAQAWPDAVAGDELLQEIADLYRRFVFIQNQHAYDVEAVFTVLTYCFEHFRSLPYIHLPSPMPESGKTRNLELLEYCCNKAYIFIDPTAAVIFRFVDEFKPTLLLDEVDNIFAGGDEDSKQLRGILNSGYTAGKFVPRVATRSDGSRYVEMFSPYGPKVLAGIRSIPQTLRSRCIVIPMMRKLAGEEVEEFDEPVRLEVEKVAGVIRSKIVRWVDDQLTAGAFDIRPEFPPGLGDRMRDCWRPLFVIANVAGGTWPERVREAAISLSTRVVAEDEDEVGMLLEDLRAFYEAPERAGTDLDWIPTYTLITYLNNLEHRPWTYLPGNNGITPAKLGILLKLATNGLAVPTPRKVEGNVFRGYAFAPIKDSIERYLGRRDPA